MLGVLVAPIPVAAAAPGLAPEAAGPARVVVAVRAAVAAAPDPGPHLTPEAALAARRTRERARRRMKSAVMVLTKPRRVAAVMKGAVAAGAAALRTKKARKNRRGAEKMNQGPDHALAPGLDLGQESRIALRNPAPRAIRRKAMRRGEPLREARVLDHAPLLNPSPEPDQSPSLNQSPVPPHLPKPDPRLPPAQSLAPNRAPHHAHALVLVPSPETGTSCHEPLSYLPVLLLHSPKILNHVFVFLFLKCVEYHTLGCLMFLMQMLLHFILFFIQHIFPVVFYLMEVFDIMKWE